MLSTLLLDTAISFSPNYALLVNYARDPLDQSACLSSRLLSRFGFSQHLFSIIWGADCVWFTHSSQKKFKAVVSSRTLKSYAKDLTLKEVVPKEHDVLDTAVDEEMSRIIVLKCFRACSAWKRTQWGRHTNMRKITKNKNKELTILWLR